MYRIFIDYLLFYNNKWKLIHYFLSGCGTKGSAFIGSLKYLYEKDIIKNVKRYVCVSGSSIIGVILCCGYNINTIYHINDRFKLY